MYSLPSTSVMHAPWPRWMIGASPPTARKARTGEFTPPGMSFSARFCSARDFVRVRGTARHSNQRNGAAIKVDMADALPEPRPHNPAAAFRHRDFRLFQGARGFSIVELAAQ